MIQLGNHGNFVHAIWLGEMKDKLSLENNHFLGTDHIIVTGKDVREDLGRIQSANPGIVIAGQHGCMVNCSECCDTPAYGNYVVRRYCEYLTEVGSYCMVKLLGHKADRVCESWFCSPYCDSSIDHFSGVPQEVPDINDKVKGYPLEKKLEFLGIIGAVVAGKSLGDLVSLSSRAKEVMMYKNAKCAMEMIARSEGSKGLLYDLMSDRFEDAESRLGSNGHLAALRRWSEIYRKRKGLSLEDVRRR